MRILIFSDTHWSTNTSIVRQRGLKYSVRLENLIKSLNWINEKAIQENCDCMICAGDMFDHSQLNDEEISALREINWNDLSCYFLVGNHESSVNGLTYNTTKVLEEDNHIVISGFNYSIIDDNTKSQIHFIPYIIDSDRESISNYLRKCDENYKHIIISHNDIKGINYGEFISKSGFDISEIEDVCDLYLNGHLHNQYWVSDKILNVGSLSAHNFTNDSFKYKYGIWILDTSTMKIDFIENPYSLNFYKVIIENETDLKILDSLKDNSVVSIKCNIELSSELLEKLKDIKNILTYKLNYFIISTDDSAMSNSLDIKKFSSLDHLSKFKEFVLKNLVNSEAVLYELDSICDR